MVVFAQGPIGLYATSWGVTLIGAARVIGVDDDASRAEMALRFGAYPESPARTSR